MNTLDLDKVQEAMDFLAETEEGDAALYDLSQACEALRKKLPTKLEDAEMRYILERLMSQRSLGNWDKRIDRNALQGFDVQPVAGLFPQVTGVKEVPDPLKRNTRALNFGFNIKASIPASQF